MAYATVQTVMLTDAGKNGASKLKYVVKFSLIFSISIKLVSTLLKRVPAFLKCSDAFPSACLLSFWAFSILVLTSSNEDLKNSYSSVMTRLNRFLA